MSDQFQPPNCAVYTSQFSTDFGCIPSLGAGIAFTVLFGLSAFAHAVQARRTRAAWQVLFVLGAGFECCGWIARLVAHFCVYDDMAFKMQIAMLIFSPAFNQAGIYVVLYVMVTVLGRDLLPIPAKAYLVTCLVVDLCCLSLQAAGGGLAGAEDGGDTKPGTTIMVVGIVVQLISTIIFSISLDCVLFRGRMAICKNPYMRLLSATTLLAIGCMIVRGMYRSVELLQGWHGYLITNERYAIACDGVMMLLVVALFNLCNAGWLLVKAAVFDEKFGDRTNLRSSNVNTFEKTKTLSSV